MADGHALRLSTLRADRLAEVGISDDGRIRDGGLAMSRAFASRATAEHPVKSHLTLMSGFHPFRTLSLSPLWVDNGRGRFGSIDETVF